MRGGFRFLGRCFIEEDRELVATEARRGVTVADAVAETARDFGEKEIAGVGL